MAVVSVSTSSSSSSSSSLRQPNTWPSKEVWGEDNAMGFEKAIQAYYDEMCRVAHGIVTAICDGMNHTTTTAAAAAAVQTTPTTTSTSTTTTTPNISPSIQSLKRDNSITHTSILTLLGYRKGKRHQGKRIRPLIAAHTDVGVITVLLFNGGDSAMLQRAAKQQNNHNTPPPPPPTQPTPETQDEWVDVTLPRSVPTDPIFVVNIGDCLSDLSGGVLPSTLHRVMPMQGSGPRSCLAYFVGLDSEKEIVLPDGTTVQYEEWRRRRIARAAAVLQK